MAGGSGVTTGVVTTTTADVRPRQGPGLAPTGPRPSNRPGRPGGRARPAFSRHWNAKERSPDEHSCGTGVRLNGCGSWVVARTGRPSSYGPLLPTHGYRCTTEQRRAGHDQACGGQPDGSDALIAKPTDPDFDRDAGYDAVTTPQMSTREVFARFWKLTRGDRRWMIVATILLIAAAAADTGAILLFAYVIDNVLTNGGGLHAFWKPAGAWAGITILSTLVSYAGSILSTWVGERFVLRLRTNLHGQVASAAPDFLDSTRLGDVLTRFTEDLEDVEAPGRVRDHRRGDRNRVGGDVQRRGGPPVTDACPARADAGAPALGRHPPVQQPPACRRGGAGRARQPQPDDGRAGGDAGQHRADAVQRPGARRGPAAGRRGAGPGCG